MLAQSDAQDMARRSAVGLVDCIVIKLLRMPINVNKCLLDIACNQLISIHLNVEFIEVSLSLCVLAFARYYLVSPSMPEVL